MAALKILTFNWHEAYLCLLSKTGHDFTVVDKFKGGHEGWLLGTRPVPANVRLLPIGSEEEVLSQARSGGFDLAICHNLRDLADVSKATIPKIVVFHNMISTEIALHKASGQPCPSKEQYIAQFLSLFDENTKAVFISETKRRDATGIEGRIILPGIDMDEYSGYRGDSARVLRVGNFFVGRNIMLGQSIANAATQDLPVTVLGINPQIPESRLSASWEDLKEHYRSHRVFLNTTVDGYEDGYNLAMLESMATGMPIVSTLNRTSPLSDGIDGFVSNNPETLHGRMKILLADRGLAQRMGVRARYAVAEKFPLARFIEQWNEIFSEMMQARRPEKRKIADQTRGNAAPDITNIEKEGQKLLSIRAWSQARSYLEKRLEDFPEAALVWKMLGFAYGNLGRAPDAIRAFWAAGKLDPADQEAQEMHLGGLASIAPGAHPEDNPEAAALVCVCSGKGIDVGCGPNKTSPGAIGVDLVPAGSPGTAGGVKGLKSVADVCASGDDLFMFQDGELDYVVSRHNLEHYQDPLKALEEWKRVLKPGGILGLVLPDDRNNDTIHLDETHKHVFTADSLRRLIRYLGDFNVVHLGTCLQDWSFTAIFRKCGGEGQALDYQKAYLQAQSERCLRRAQQQEEAGEPAQALECWREAAEMDPGNPIHLQGQIRMLRRLGRLEEAEAVFADLKRRFPHAAQFSQCGRIRMIRDADGERASDSQVSSSVSQKRILLSYCSNPMTTATYLERALRKRHDVLTWGPAIDADMLKAWNMEALRDRVSQTNLGYENSNVSETLKRMASGWIPDVFLWIESGVQFAIQGLADLPCSKACYLIDTHHDLPNDRRIESHLQWARQFDIVFLAQRAYVDRFKSAGLNAYWLPLGCDPEIHRDEGMQRVHPISFVGSLTDQRRADLIKRLQSRLPVFLERCFLEDMTRVFSQSKIVFNNAVNNDLNMRVFEVMASGALLLTDPAPGSGLEEFFRDKKHLVLYRNDEELCDIAEKWLLNEPDREQVARTGQAEVLARHTYDHRARQMEEILFSTSGNAVASDMASSSADLRLEVRSLMTSRRSSAPSANRQAPSSDGAEAKLGRGRILLSAGKYSEAEDLFAQWVKEDPFSQFAHIGLGCVALVCDRWEDSERHFRSALKLIPEDPKALSGLGFALAAAGRESEAADAFVMSLRKEPLQNGVLHALLRAALAAGRHSQALEAINNYMKLQPDNPHLLFSAAVLTARLGDTEEALRLLDCVEAIQNSYPNLSSYRAAWSNPPRAAGF